MHVTHLELRMMTIPARNSERRWGSEVTLYKESVSNTLRTRKNIMPQELERDGRDLGATKERSALQQW